LKTLIGNESIRRSNRISSFVQQRRSVTDHDSFHSILDYTFLISRKRYVSQNFSIVTGTNSPEF